MGVMMTHPAFFIEISDKKIFLATRLFIFRSQSTDNTRLQENNKHLFIGRVRPLKLFVNHILNIFYNSVFNSFTHSRQLTIAAITYQCHSSLLLVACRKLGLGTESNKTSL